MEFFLPDGEKRIFPRARLNICCELSLTEQAVPVQGRCMDLSTNGARVLVNQSFNEGDTVIFHLREHLGKEPFRALAEIIRVEKTTLQGQKPAADADIADRFTLGLRITEILK